jgi:hypothetical protein
MRGMHLIKNEHLAHKAGEAQGLMTIGKNRKPAVSWWGNPPPL